ncbi:MAG TPA: glutaredoxin domain-containing protein [Myxococcales bacterium]|jgi:glutaredoxin
MSLAACLVCLALGAAAPAPPAPAAAAKDDALAAARKALEAGDYEKVLDEVNAARGAAPAEAAVVLTGAGQVALGKKDRAMASLYCEMAIKRAPGERAPLDLCLKIAFEEERWEDVAIWGEALARLAPKDADVALLRGHAAVNEGDWKRAIEILKPHAKGPKSAQVAPLMDRAEQQVQDEKAAASEQKALEDRLKKAIAAARALDDGGGGGGGPSSPSGVYLYTTTWCGVCKKAKAWLDQKRISYVERDVENDLGASEELAEKCKKARTRPRGVPVLDARGKIVVGFSPGSYGQLLR